MTQLFKFLGFWPLWAVRAAGFALGWLNWLTSESQRRRMRRNWAIAVESGLLQTPGAQADRLMRESIAHSGLLIAELPKIWCDASAIRLASHHGFEHVRRALALGKGVVVLTPHLGAFEMAARVVSQQTPFTVLYRPARQLWFRRLMERYRPRPGLETAPASAAGVRKLLRALRAGQAIGMLPDQVPAVGEGEWVPFFGQPAYTMTLPIRLIQATGAAVVWMLALRKPGGWAIHFEPWELPAELLTAPVPEALLAMNKSLEGQIAKAPEQYLWSYKRYKKPKRVVAT